MENNNKNLAAIPSNPADLLKVAQEMVNSVTAKADEGEKSEKAESEFSSQDIEAVDESRQAVIEEMAAKVGGMQSGIRDKESREIVQEAWGNWEEGLK
ncbi:MAG: hypothetical protein AB2L14_34800 [Candidatus Xenobiia bacterium LiM19]